MRLSRVLRMLLVALCLAALLQPALAQSGRGNITGTVRDSTGAAVPGAEVVAVNLDNGVETRTLTTDTGTYRIPYVPPGKYRVTASMTGFKTAIRDNLTIQVTQTITADFVMEVGEIAEQVTVSSTAAILEKSTSEIGTAATELEVHTWPILVGDGTRQLQTFIFSSMPGTQGDAWSGAINGGQSFAHDILIEGMPIGRFDIAGGSNSEFTPTMDAVGEFKLQTGALSSQYGNTQTGLTNFSMKGGGNEFHGTAFWLHQNEALNANSWAGNASTPAPATAQRRQNRVHNSGFSVGGPVIKDRTHFFVSYEAHRQKSYLLSPAFDSLAVAPFKQGDYSLLFDPAFTKDARSGTVVGEDALGRPVIFGQIYDPASSYQLADGTWMRNPFPNNQIPANRFSQVSRNIEKFGLPEPQLFQLRLNNPRVSGSAPELNIDNWSIKLDHVISDNHKASGTYVSNDRSRLRFGGNPPWTALSGVKIPGPYASGDKTQLTPGWIIRVAEDWTVSPTKLNHFAIGYNRFRNANVSNSYLDGRNWVEELGLRGMGHGAAFPVVSFTGFHATLGNGMARMGHGGTGNEPNGSVIVQDDFTWIRGNHSLRFGGEHRRYYINSRSVQNSGSFTFHNENTALPGFSANTGFSHASYLLGVARNTSLGIPVLTPGTRSRVTAFYLQDDWKTSPRLTLNLGVRWDIPSPYTEAVNRMSALNPDLPNPGADGYRGALEFLGDCQGCSGRTAFAQTYWRQFAPRIGFAYAPRDNMVIRGGYGINYAPPILDGWSYGWFNGFDGSIQVNPRPGPFNENYAYQWDGVYPQYQGMLPNTDPAQLNGSNIPYYLPETNRMPLTQNWNFGIQYELPWQTRLEANYVGSKGTRLNDGSYRYSLNQVDPRHLALGATLTDHIDDHPEIAKPYPSFDGTVAQALRPFPQYYDITTHRLNGGYSNYNSLQTTLTKRTTQGLSFLTAYTFSKAMGTSDDALGYYSGTAQNFYNRKEDYSVTSFHIPHDLKVTWIYDIPVGPGRRYLGEGAAGKILGGWTISSIQRYRSGSPLAVFTGGYEYEALFNPGFRPNVVSGVEQKIGGVPTQVDRLNGTPYLNPAAFAALPKHPGTNIPTQLGNAPRFLPGVRGFARFSEDFSLIKRNYLGFREDLSLEIRIDVVNLFNRAWFNNPETNINDLDRFGKVFGKGGGPRTIQGGLRVNF
jgi:hypothetical protein